MAQRIYKDPFVSEAAETGNAGLRRSTALLVERISVEDPAFTHIAAVLREMVAADVEINETAVEVALKLGRRAWLVAGWRTSEEREKSAAPVAEGLPMWGAGEDRSAIVYYIRRSALIKIGTTTRPENRFGDLLPDEILAFEPGGLRLEAIRHRQFGHLWEGREHFRPALELEKHIHAMRQMHGDPDPAWRTTASLDDATAKTLPRNLGSPTSTEMIKVVMVPKRFGLKYNTVLTWVRRGKLPIAGLDEEGRLLVFVEHVEQLAARSRAASNKRPDQQKLIVA